MDPEYLRRLRAALPRHHGQARRGGRVLRPLLGGLPRTSAPSSISRRRAGSSRCATWRRRSSISSSSTGRHLERARRRPRPQPFPRAGVRPRGVPGLPRVQVGLRPEGPHEPGQHRGEPGRHRAPALRPGVQDVGAQDPAGLLRPGRLRGGGGDVQRGGSVPEEARRHHVPVLHGDAGRGAFHARSGQCPLAPCSRARCRPPISRASGCTR